MTIEESHLDSCNISQLKCHWLKEDILDRPISVILLPLTPIYFPSYHLSLSKIIFYLYYLYLYYLPLPSSPEQMLQNKNFIPCSLLYSQSQHLVVNQ